MGVVQQFERPTVRGGVLVPGLPVLPPGMERHSVPGGGSRAVEIEAGDVITIVDREGLQPGELVLFDPEGRADPSRLGVRNPVAAEGLQGVLASNDPSAQRVRKALEKAGFDLAGAKGVRVFEEASRPGDSASFTAEGPGLLIAAAVGGPMAVDSQDSLTELVLYVKRARPALHTDRRPPPDPLSDPLADINIQPGQARAYEVKKGQYIQVVDNQGRECSDFQALDLRAVEKGRIADIDTTTTRSLMGSLYPEPGLFARYFSMDMLPLVEIVQDTCGRHDSLGLSCTARYYEDLGYPGHINCTDNINRE